MKGLDFFEPRGCKLTLRWRSLVHSDAYENLAKECKDTGGIVEARNDGRFSMWLRQIRAGGDADRG